MIAYAVIIQNLVKSNYDLIYLKDPRIENRGVHYYSILYNSVLIRILYPMDIRLNVFVRCHCCGFLMWEVNIWDVYMQILLTFENSSFEIQWIPSSIHSWQMFWYRLLDPRAGYQWTHLISSLLLVIDSQIGLSHFQERVVWTELQNLGIESEDLLSILITNDT